MHMVVLLHEELSFSDKVYQCQDKFKSLRAILDMRR